jgi:hypothetical protein
MCIVIGKYFPEIGWVGLKNRDRNYVPEISFKKIYKHGVEICYFWDDITRYCEGFNSAGVGILSASLMVIDDEKEITNRAKTPSKDGKKIKKALEYPDVKAAAMSVIKQELTGNTLIFDSEHMYLLEAAHPAKNGYNYQVREIPRDETVTRTNHGIWLPHTGYQRGNSEAEDMSRISSESRWLIANEVAQEAENPEDILDNLTRNYTNNGQLNALRTTTDKKKMRTTSQIMIIPSEQTMYIRPVQSHMNFNFWDLNNTKQQTWVEILSNRVLYHNLKGVDFGKELPFDSLNHNS